MSVGIRRRQIVDKDQCGDGLETDLTRAQTSDFMPRILIAECKQEVSTFNPHLSGYDDFAVRRGEEMLRYHRSVRNEVGGALSVFEAQPDVELVPTYSAFFITSGGTLARHGVAAHRGRVPGGDSCRAAGDGVYFCMHGAMASEDEVRPRRLAAGGDAEDPGRGRSRSSCRSICTAF